MLPFSRQFRSDEKVLQDVFAPPVLNSELWQKLTAEAVPKGIKAKRLEGPMLTFEQLEGAAVTLDPGYDPNTKLRRLAGLADDAGVDALLIGHLREEAAAQGPVLHADLRLLVTEPNVLVTERSRWSAKVTKRKEIKKKLGAMVGALWSRVQIEGTGALIANEGAGGQLRYSIQAGDNLHKISRRCFEKDVSFVADYIAKYNSLSNANLIKPGDTLLIPARIGVQTRICHLPR